MLICQCNAMHRRDVVCGGGASVFSAIVAALMGGAKPVHAETIAGSVPEIDRVALPRRRRWGAEHTSVWQPAHRGLEASYRALDAMARVVLLP
jgi:hypothetical protein